MDDVFAVNHHHKPILCSKCKQNIMQCKCKGLRIKELGSINARLTAQVERLEKALDEIIEAPFDELYPEETVGKMRDIARRAREGE